MGGFRRPPFRLGHEAGLPVERRYWRTRSGLEKTLGETIDRLAKGGVGGGTR